MRSVRLRWRMLLGRWRLRCFCWRCGLFFRQKKRQRSRSFTSQHIAFFPRLFGGTRCSLGYVVLGFGLVDKESQALSPAGIKVTNPSTDYVPYDCRRTFEHSEPDGHSRYTLRGPNIRCLYNIAQEGSPSGLLVRFVGPFLLGHPRVSSAFFQLQPYPPLHLCTNPLIRLLRLALFVFSSVRLSAFFALSWLRLIFHFCQHSFYNLLIIKGKNLQANYLQLSYKNFCRH